MRLVRFGLEFGMELASEEPGVVGGFDYFYIIFIGGAAGDLEAGAGQNFFVIAIEFVAVAVALADFEFAVGAMGEGAGLEVAGPGAEAHGGAHFGHAEELAHVVD